MKRIFALLLAAGALSAVSASAADSSSMNGWISDSMCGAKHAGSGAACVKKCVEGGMQPVFVSEKDKSVLTIDNPDTVKEYYGSKVTVKGTVGGDGKSVHIDSVTAAK
ncbi:hypothetical protein [Occallatibacter riparius]|uniref:DUF5666 domain-containing protein n=1 Tax=Occallatibacter riparius TaxID=1002689 RepID=A0A9J7BKK6_9BACT|nr:hypothetical protein [Occallatibacter riparius]UWZ82977.1 hypothetical protein MOP44_20690 [Occallatibacter riparius]